MSRVKAVAAVVLLAVVLVVVALILQAVLADPAHAEGRCVGVDFELRNLRADRVDRAEWIQR